jgi:hypothetical protein
MRDEIFYAHAPTDDSLEMSRLWKGRYDNRKNFSVDLYMSSLLFRKIQNSDLSEMQKENDQSRTFLLKGFKHERF